MAREFANRFSIRLGQEESRRRFVNRALNDLFDEFLGINALMAHMDAFQIRRIEAAIASALGERHVPTAVLQLVARSFLDCLRSIEGLYSAHSGDAAAQRSITAKVQRLLQEAEVDLGVTWNAGRFMPSGAKELDDALVNEPLRWLANPGLQSIRGPYAKAIEHYLESTKSPGKLADVVTDLYEALEAAAKLITGRDEKDLSANAELLISKLGVSSTYKRILKEYITYANQFRHAATPDEPRHAPSRGEVESFLYLTGIFLRLAQRSLEAT
jgi:hypothetical protein